MTIVSSTQMSMTMKSIRSLGNTMSIHSRAAPLHLATYRDVCVSVERLEAASIVLTCQDLVHINLVSFCHALPSLTKRSARVHRNAIGYFVCVSVGSTSVRII